MNVKLIYLQAFEMSFNVLLVHLAKGHNHSPWPGFYARSNMKSSSENSILFSENGLCIFPNVDSSDKAICFSYYEAAIN